MLEFFVAQLVINIVILLFILLLHLRIKRIERLPSIKDFLKKK